MPTPTNPTDFAMLGHRTGLYMDYAGSLTNWIDRLQSLEPGFNAGTEVYNELGNVDPVGFAQDPVDFTLTFSQNMFNSVDSDFLMAGKDPSTATSFSMADILSANGNSHAYILYRSNTGTTTPQSWLAMRKLTVAELSYSFAVRQPSMFSPRLQAPTGRWYTANPTDLSAAVGSWGTADTTSAGAIRGRDARITIGNGQVYRLQSFNIRAAFPITKVEELGTRAAVGYIGDVPDISIDFEMLLADASQPHNQWAPATGSPSYLDFNNLTGGSMVYVNLYSPSAAEAVTAVRGWRLENVVAVSSTPARSQVRGLSTVRYSLRVSEAATAGTGGMTVFRGVAS